MNTGRPGEVAAPLHRALAAERVALGTWSIVADDTLAEIAASAGLDFVLLDLEHGAWDIGTLERAVRAVEGQGAAPLVRVPDLTPATFQRVLDLGAHGVVVPQVRGAADARTAVACARYAPAGRRGYNPFTRAAGYAAPARSGSGKLAADFPLVAVIVENAAASADLPAICAVEGVSIVYLGVFDMSLELGCDGDVRHPAVIAWVRQACDTIRAAGKTVGVMVRSEEQMDEALELGARVLVWGVDANVIRNAWATPVAALADRLDRKGT